MALTIHEESHLDHGLKQEQIDWLLDRFKDKNEFFIETVTLPEELGNVPCGLYGPAMGDTPIHASEVDYKIRGDRTYPSRIIEAPLRLVRNVTVIAGPHEDEPCIIYTAFGGPLAPKEPGDPRLEDHERAESEKFWSEHALVRA